MATSIGHQTISTSPRYPKQSLSHGSAVAAAVMRDSLRVQGPETGVSRAVRGFYFFVLFFYIRTNDYITIYYALTNKMAATNTWVPMQQRRGWRKETKMCPNDRDGVDVHVVSRDTPDALSIAGIFGTAKLWKPVCSRWWRIIFETTKFNLEASVQVARSPGTKSLDQIWLLVRGV